MPEIYCIRVTVSVHSSDIFFFNSLTFLKVFVVCFSVLFYEQCQFEDYAFKIVMDYSNKISLLLKYQQVFLNITEK